LGYVSAIDSNGRTIWIADAHRDNGRRFVVHADEKLNAFIELESAINQSKLLAKDQNGCYLGTRRDNPLEAISQTRERSEFRAISEPARV
jgi:hypothetical protein